MPTTARSSKDWNSFSPYLWSVFLELATLLDKFFPRLLTFILSVSQYCCCGIEFSLSRKTTKGTTVRVLIITKIKIKACMSITSSGISRRLGCTAVQNKAPSFQKRETPVLASSEGLQPFSFHLATKIPFFLKSIHAFITTLLTLTAEECNTHLLMPPQSEWGWQILNTFKPGLFSHACRYWILPLWAFLWRKLWLTWLLVNPVLLPTLVMLQSLSWWMLEYLPTAFYSAEQKRGFLPGWVGPAQSVIPTRVPLLRPTLPDATTMDWMVTYQHRKQQHSLPCQPVPFLRYFYVAGKK